MKSMHGPCDSMRKAGHGHVPWNHAWNAHVLFSVAPQRTIFFEKLVKILLKSLENKLEFFNFNLFPV